MLSNTTINEVWGVASFYTNFRFTPPGRHVIEVCWGPTCHLAGATDIIDSVQRHLGLSGEGETEDGQVSLKYNTCLGACAQPPVASLDHKLVGRLTVDSAKKAVDRGPEQRRLRGSRSQNTMATYQELKAEADRRWQGRQSDKPWIRVGTAMCGQAAGARDALAAIESELDARGVDANVDEVGCLGLCFAEPLVDVQIPGRSRLFFSGVTPEDVPSIVDSYVAARRVPDRNVLGYLGEDPIDGVPDLMSLPGMRYQHKIALRNAGHIAPDDAYQYLANEGYSALRRAITAMEPSEVIQAVTDSGLRGRGGAAFATGIKWSFLVRSPGPPKYILCNCEEGDPGAFNDKGILESDPHMLLEGMAIAGYATGATNGIVFIRHGHDGPIDRTERAIEQAYELGLLGDNILDTGWSFDIEVALTGESYVSGEETALMDAVEGKRAMPRFRPPFPAQVGVWGKPTNINNVKTLAYAPSIIANGSEWFSGIGVNKSTGTAIICLSGDIERPGLYEVPMGLTLGPGRERRRRRGARGQEA